MIYPESIISTARALNSIDYILVGGLMVHMHCELVGISPIRSTEDIDIVVDVPSSSIMDAARELEKAGFVINIPLSNDSKIHNFVHPEGWEVDMMTKDEIRNTSKIHGHEVVACPGSKSVLGSGSAMPGKPMITIPVSDDVTMKIPDVWSALALKGHAYRTTGDYRERHIEDALILFACSTFYDKRELSNSERRGYNYIIASGLLENPDTWYPLSHDKQLMIRARDGLFSYRNDPGVVIPEIIRNLR